MNGTKPWWQSNTVWASILQAFLGLAVMLGLISDVQSDLIFAEGPELIVGLITLALGGWGLFGRVRATKTLTGVTDSGDTTP